MEHAEHIDLHVYSMYASSNRIEWQIKILRIRSDEAPVLVHDRTVLESLGGPPGGGGRLPRFYFGTPRFPVSSLSRGRFPRFCGHVIREIGKFSRAYGAEHSC